jgi:hypothetical protein
MHSTFLIFYFSCLLHVGGGQGTLPVLVKNVMYPSFSLYLPLYYCHSHIHSLLHSQSLTLRYSLTWKCIRNTLCVRACFHQGGTGELHTLPHVSMGWGTGLDPSSFASNLPLLLPWFTRGAEGGADWRALLHQYRDKNYLELCSYNQCYQYWNLSSTSKVVHLSNRRWGPWKRGHELEPPARHPARALQLRPWKRALTSTSIMATMANIIYLK